MNPLQYTSEEMFSSTELIRKSKMVFDKLHNQDIEKAIILRDGKPSFMLLDFSEYEKLMGEYLMLKEMLNKKETPSIKKEKKEAIQETIEKEQVLEEANFEEDIKENPDCKIEVKEELGQEDLESALAEIDKLDLENIENIEEFDTSSLNTVPKEEEPLKEFWE